MEIYIAGQNDEAMEVGSGLSEIEASLLLSYEMHPHLSPYIGVQWSKVYGETADYAQEEADGDSDAIFVLGVSAEF